MIVVVFVAQRRQERRPVGAAAGKTVNQQQRRADATGPHLVARAVDVDVAHPPRSRSPASAARADATVAATVW